LSREARPRPLAQRRDRRSRTIASTSTDRIGRGDCFSSQLRASSAFVGKPIAPLFEPNARSNSRAPAQSKAAKARRPRIEQERWHARGARDSREIAREGDDSETQQGRPYPGDLVRAEQRKRKTKADDHGQPNARHQRPLQLLREGEAQRHERHGLAPNDRRASRHPREGKTHRTHRRGGRSHDARNDGRENRNARVEHQNAAAHSDDQREEAKVDDEGRCPRRCRGLRRQVGRLRHRPRSRVIGLFSAIPGRMHAYGDAKRPARLLGRYAGAGKTLFTATS
jgi:hypothetical protein